MNASDLKDLHAQNICAQLAVTAPIELWEYIRGINGYNDWLTELFEYDERNEFVVVLGDDVILFSQDPEFKSWSFSDVDLSTLIKDADDTNEDGGRVINALLDAGVTIPLINRAATIPNESDLIVGVNQLISIREVARAVAQITTTLRCMDPRLAGLAWVQVSARVRHVRNDIDLTLYEGPEFGVDALGLSEERADILQRTLDLIATLGE